MMMLLLVVMLVGATYSYLLYPLTLVALASVRRHPESTAVNDPFRPVVSFIVTAHNEEARLQQKLENTLAIVYEPLEIIVASDCSSDGTDRIAQSFADRGVALVRTPERKGKENAQRQAIQAARGQILVFSDVGTSVDPNSLTRLVTYFADPEVGAVSSEDRFVREDGTLVGEGAYVRYEMWLRRLESALGGLVGLSGSFFAARREVCESWDSQTPSDFNAALSCARLGFRAVTAPDVIGYYRDLKDPRHEYRRKVRTILRGITGLARNLDVMSSRYGLFAWQVASHKLMRWLAPLFFVGLFIVSLILYREHWFPRLLFHAQAAGYGLAILVWLVPVLNRFALARLVHFFCQANIAIVHAGYLFIAGRRMTVWEPSAR